MDKSAELRDDGRRGRSTEEEDPALAAADTRSPRHFPHSLGTYVVPTAGEGMLPAEARDAVPHRNTQKGPESQHRGGSPDETNFVNTMGSKRGRSYLSREVSA